MAIPSYYFTLFKKFQVLGHLPENDFHGTPGGSGTGFDLTDPNSVFTAIGGTLLGANSASSPLWAMLNAAANGQSSVMVGGTTYPAMPTDTTTAAWNDFQVSPLTHKLVQTFADWIDGPPGKVNDIPTGVIGIEPGAIGAPPDSGVSPFVCSFGTDDGTRPGGVPGDYWDTSLIYLVDPASGNIVTPSSLTGGTEYYLVAVIGNRGQSAGGLYSAGGVKLEAKGIAMVWNTTFSPGVELPALSNLDINIDSSLYGQYFLGPGQYDVVGFRLNVQTVFDGIVAAVAASGMDLGGKSPVDWVKDPAQSAHLCAKVVVRQGADTFQNVGDTPLTTNKIGQKNLAPFAANLAVVSPDPNIIWKNFMLGQPFFIRLGQREGRNTLILEENLPREAFRLYIAITTRTFERYFREGGGGEFKGFKVVSHEELCEGKLGERAKPFPQAVILRYLGGANAIELPALGEEEFLGMSIGIEYSVRKLKPGEIGKVRLVHKCVLPTLVPGTRCFELNEVTAGGFTILVRATDPRQALKTLATKG